MRGYPCMCGGCARCLRDQGVYECPHCGAFGGCDCEREPEEQEELEDRIDAARLRHLDILCGGNGELEEEE